MKILFVLNNFYATGNGLSASARRTVKYLREAGEEVRILSGPNSINSALQPDYLLGDFRLPVFDFIIRAHGYHFAKVDRKVIEDALDWADLVHFEEPFLLERVAIKMARRRGIPCTATYHLHPENIFSSIYLGRFRPLNHLLMRIWRNGLFDRCSDVSVPTENSRERLEKFHFKARLHVLSNGILPERSLRVKRADNRPPYHIISIGRLAMEKDQYTIFRAMKYSRHAADIRLSLAGRGPEAQHMKRVADRLYRKGYLNYPVEFLFTDRDGVRQLASRADLYIHAAKVEVEGLSALEALQQEVVPIVATGRLTATSQFVLDKEHGTFPVGNARALARQIDWWIDHPEERFEMGRRVAQSTLQYEIHAEIAKLIAMFRQASGRE